MKKKRGIRNYILNRIILGETVTFLLLCVILVCMKTNDASVTTSNDLSKDKLPQQEELEEVTPDNESGNQEQPSKEVTPLPNTEQEIQEEQTNEPQDLDTTEELEDEEEPVKSEDAENPVKSEDAETVPVFAKGMSQQFIDSLKTTQEGTILSHEGLRDIIYYNQTDPRWAEKEYGEKDTIREYGCGPTSLAIVISTLTDYRLDPEQMCAWAYEKGYWFPKQGSKHYMIPEACTAFGLQVTGYANEPGVAEKLKDALSHNSMVIALMGKGTFTKSGHFIVFYGLDEEGKVYVADPQSEENTNQTWEITRLVNEAKSWAGGGGPFWVIDEPKKN